VTTGQTIRTIILLSILFISIVLFGSGPAATESQNIENSLKFHWAFVALTSPSENEKLRSITEDTVLKSGDQFKMMITFESGCFIYLIYHGSGGEMQLLFPKEINPYQRPSPNNERYYIPSGNNWFTLDENTGIEKFYLLASANPLNKLESLLKQYDEASASGQPDIASQVIRHVKQLRKDNRKLESSVDRPVQIGGNFRTLGKPQQPFNTISKYAVTISGNKFFARTYTIEHR